MTRLLKEFRYFTEHKTELLRQYPNKFILIKDDQILGAYANQTEAYNAGVERFGNKPFLIKMVADVPDVPAQTPALWVGSLTRHDT